MTEADLTFQNLSIRTLPSNFVHENPRETLTVLGEKITLGETLVPHEKYPGWSLTLFTFTENPNKDGCFFIVAPNTATPIGYVRELEQKIEGIIPSFTEYLIKGSGFLLIETPDGIVQKIEVSSDKPIIFQYGVGTKIAYVAGPDGLEGINIGHPAGIPEDSLEDNDLKASAKLWEEYHKLFVK